MARDWLRACLNNEPRRVVAAANRAGGTRHPGTSCPLRPTLALLGVAAIVTLYFLVGLKPSSVGAFTFAAVWLTVPHAAMAVLLLALQRRGKPLLPWCIAAALAAAFGLYVLVDAIYLHPDAQSAIAVVIAPVLQGIVFLVAAPLAWWAGRRQS